MPNYQNSKIYKLYDITTNEQYIGSTTQKLCLRLGGHVADYKKYLNGKHNNITSFKIIEGGNYRIELIEAFPCNNKEELHQREGHFIRTLDCVNKMIAGRTCRQYYKDNRENLLEQKKDYYINNKDEKLEYNKKYYEKNKDYLIQQVSDYRIKNLNRIKEHQKQFREQNKDKIRKNKKQYYENNKERIKEKAKQKIQCECGLILRKSDLSAHKRSKKHIQYIESLQ